MISLIFSDEILISYRKILHYLIKILFPKIIEIDSIISHHHKSFDLSLFLYFYPSISSLYLSIIIYI